MTIQMYLKNLISTIESTIWWAQSIQAEITSIGFLVIQAEIIGREGALQWTGCY